MKPLDINALLNSGVVRTNDTPPKDTATLIVVGLPRSGTSMVAAVLREFGVFMGDKIDNAVHEDVELATALEAGDRKQFQQLVTARNERHPIWGFKRPEAYRQLDVVCSLLRNPRIIVPFRDILAIATRNEISMQSDPVALLPKLAADYQSLVAAIGQTSAPVLMLSYEKALQFPSKIATEIGTFAGLRVSEQQAIDASGIIENSAPRYVRSARLNYQGSVGRLADGFLRGWVKIVDRDESRVAVQLELDGKVVATTVADLHRPDVERAGHGDGRYGFAFKITDDMDRNSAVTVRVQHSRVALQNSGRPLASYSPR